MTLLTTTYFRDERSERQRDDSFSCNLSSAEHELQVQHSGSFQASLSMDPHETETL